MSRIIKKTDFVLSSPKIIKGFTDLQREVAVVQQAELSVDEAFLAESLVQESDILEEKRRELELIKAESAQILVETEELVKEIMARAKDEARGIVVIAQDEVDVLKQSAAVEAEQIKKDAFEGAYREGLRRANEDIEADRQLAMEQSQRMVAEAQQQKFDIIRSTETDMVRLIIAISKKVIAHELSTRPELIVGIVREAVSYLDNPDHLNIYVNPRDLNLLVERLATERLPVEGRGVPVEIKADSTVEQGGCVIESGGASVDATIDTRLNKVESAMMEIPGSES